MDFTECYSDTVSSLAVAARERNVRRVSLLIQRGCSVDSRDNRGWNALHEAAAAGTIVCVRQLLKAAAGATSGCRAYVGSLTHEGESALYLAVQRRHLAVVKLLLRAHADINQPTNDLSCPLYAAVDCGHTDIVELLVRKGAEVNGTHTASCWTCLHQAAYKGHSDIVRILVGVCRLEVFDDHMITPLFVAAQYGQKQCLQILADAGANVNAQASDLATPLLIASQEGHEGCVEILLDHNANPNLSCSNNWPQLPIHAAAEFGHNTVLARLIAVTHRVCDRGEGELSPLYSAVKNNHSHCVDLLLRAGFSPDAQDCSSLFSSDTTSPLAYTLALKCTSSQPFSDSARLLVAAGATLTGREWFYILAMCKSDVLQYVLQQRSIPRPEQLSRTISLCSRPEQQSNSPLSPEELRGLVCEALDMVCHASYWLPTLLQAGLEPSLLLQKPYTLRKADSEVLNYFLQFVNWSTLSHPLKEILLPRKESTWRPHHECVPSLSHLCRLRVREELGSVVLMQTAVVRQLPLPPPLQIYLQFRDIPPPSHATTVPQGGFPQRL
ncbi:ankyrin repeat and SOCS box protein 3 isoform X1 [Oncorhynchus clarkii lewisi]|uniref:ankyrin repeat and SOCS box protein 3 isoform X1 n=1 Tax=Oncorhynchus clarkii lewisi TaxID=490388 RepID=UPI0039B9C1E8